MPRSQVTSADEIEVWLRKAKPTLPQRLVRQIIMCLQIGVGRRTDPNGVSIAKGVLAHAGTRDPPVQICFSFDTTGSMAAYITRVREQLTKLVGRLLRHIPGVQVSIAAHGDYGDESNYVVKAINFSDDNAKLQQFIESCGNTGGGDHPECYELVMYKMQELGWAATSAKALVMIGDAPPHGAAKYRKLGRPFIDWKKVADWYAKRSIHIYGIKCGNTRETFYDEVAKITSALVIKIEDIDLMPELFTELCFREQQRWALAMHPPARWDVRAIADPKAALMNVCGSCLLAQPNFHESVDVTKDRIRLLCKRLAREGQGEFVLKMALYCRTQLYLRSVSNYLAALAAELPSCREHLGTYFRHLVRLPTDMQEVAKMSMLQRPGHMARARHISLPQSLRKAFRKKFPDFDEYQLAKHRKSERISCDGAGDGACGEEANTPGSDGADAPSEGPVLSMKGLVRHCHIQEPHELVMKVLGKRYPFDAGEFAETGLPGTFDSSLAGYRMRLKEPLTFQTQLSKKGNSKESWEELIDKKGLPFMAMLRNLRNILQAGVSDAHHDNLLRRLRDPSQVAQSMQMPHRFLTAYLAVDAAATGKAFGKGGGKAGGKGKRGRHQEDEAPAAPVALLPEATADQYKAALDCAVRLAVGARLPKLQGKTIAFCDVSGSMHYNDFAQSAKGIAGVTNASDLAILMGLLLSCMSEAPEDCIVALFSDGENSPKRLRLDHTLGVFDQYKAAKEESSDMGKTTELPLEWLSSQLESFPADRIVLFSDMLIGESRNHPGGGGRLQQVLKEHRARSRPGCKFVCVDLFGSGANSGIDHTGDSGPGDVLLSGFSDAMLGYIANPDMAAQVGDVESILDTVTAAKTKAGAQPPAA